MKKLVISAIGKDRPGIVAGVTRILFEAGCNLEDSAMTILEGEFAILLIASKPTKVSSTHFISRLQQETKDMGLVLNVKEMEVAKGVPTKVSRGAIVTASGTDQTGILFRLSTALAKLKVSITDLTSKQIPGPGKKTLYVVMFEVALPRGISLDELRRDVDPVARAMHLDITVREISSEQF